MSGETLDCTLTYICHHAVGKFNPAGVPFLIAKTTSGTIKGNMLNPVKGAAYRLHGRWAAQKGGYEDAFEFVDYEPLFERSIGGVEQYLAMHVAGIGRVKAAALVCAFGVDTLDILRDDPDKALDVKGISTEVVMAIRSHFADTKKFDSVAYARLIDLFSEYRIGKRVVEMLLKAFGSDAPEIATKNPYILLNYPRVGWKTADVFALGKAGYAPDGVERHEAATLEALERLASEGHTCATESELASQADALLGGSIRPDILARLIEVTEVVETEDDYGPVYQLASLVHAEETIADRLDSLAAEGHSLPFPLATADWIDEVGLGEDQADAVRLVEFNAVSIVTGAPGVGKSFTVAAMVGRLIAKGVRSIRCCCPTGKAAKRLAELLADVPGAEGVPSTTIHKALMPMPSAAPEGVPADDARFGRGRQPFQFARNEENPLVESVIIVDEVSMVDVKLMSSLLRAIKPGSRLIMVGDHNQLPSVGPGSVLRDMIAAGVPTAELTEIRRSDGGGTIVRACHAIKDGIVPQDADRIELKTHNWVHLEIADPHAIAAKIVELHATVKRFDPLWDMQVVSPQKQRLPIGCENLNRLLSRQLNPTAHGEDDGEDEPPFRTGDKVVRTKNAVVDELVEWHGPDDDTSKSRPDLEWRGRKWVARECAVVNGDMGQIEDIVTGSKSAVIVRFRDPERLCHLPYCESHIILAYAMTIHKLQGSGASYVIFPVHNSFYYDQKTGAGLWNRETFYTGFSRAETLLVTVGTWDAIRSAIGRKTVNRRRTTLARRLRGRGFGRSGAINSINGRILTHAGDTM